MGFCADEAHGDWNMETDIRCFWTSPVEVLTEVILAGIIAYRLQILYITTVFRRLTPPSSAFCFFEKRRVQSYFCTGSSLVSFVLSPSFSFCLLLPSHVQRNSSFLFYQISECIITLDNRDRNHFYGHKPIEVFVNTYFLVFQLVNDVFIILVQHLHLRNLFHIVTILSLRNAKCPKSLSLIIQQKNEFSFWILLPFCKYL